MSVAMTNSRQKGASNEVVRANGKEQTMRLIDADALREKLIDYIGLTNGFDRAFNETPTIDAVEVVRCKDCQWRADIIDVDTGEMYHACGVLGVEVDDEHYCSYGVRKESE